MVFSQPLVIESSLAPSDTRVRVRAFATLRDMAQLEAFRRRQIIGWRLSQAKEDSLFQPEYGDALDVEGARFVGLVERVGSGSRIRGRVMVSPLTKILMSIFMLFVVVVAAAAALRQGNEAPMKAVPVASLMLGAAVLMVRYSLWSTSRLVEARLQRCLEAAGPRAAA